MRLKLETLWNYFCYTFFLLYNVVHKDILLPFKLRFTKASILFMFPQYTLYDSPICPIHLAHILLPDFIT
jgi:hypothetical protein